MSHINPVACELLRRSHCDNKNRNHPCSGKTVLLPGCIMLECHLCGSALLDNTKYVMMNDDELNAINNTMEVFKVSKELGENPLKDMNDYA